MAWAHTGAGQACQDMMALAKAGEALAEHSPGTESPTYLSWLAVAYADANEPDAAAATPSRMLTLTDGSSEWTAERSRVVLQRLRAFRYVPEVAELLAS